MKYFAYLLLTPLFLLLAFNMYAYGSIIGLRTLAPSSTAFMNTRMAQLAERKPEVKRDYRWVDYQDISPHLKKALIASEDARFAVHGGFDWEGIRQAARRNRAQGEIRAGGSTISQQLVKNLFLNEERSYWRKAEEAALTAILEATTDKTRIYTLYLNVIEWGYGIYGAEAAAQHFYGVSAKQLNPRQAAALAARVSAPLRYADQPNDPRLRRKTEIILKRMNSAKLPE